MVEASKESLGPHLSRPGRFSYVPDLRPPAARPQPSRSAVAVRRSFPFPKGVLTEPETLRPRADLPQGLPPLAVCCRRYGRDGCPYRLKTAQLGRGFRWGGRMREDWIDSARTALLRSHSHPCVGSSDCAPKDSKFGPCSAFRLIAVVRLSVGRHP